MKKNLIASALLSIFALSGCTTINFTAQQFVPRDEYKITLFNSNATEYQVDNLEFVQSDGAISRGVYIHKPGAELTVLYFMGSGVRIDANGSYFSKPLTQLNANIISFDYRGFGRSDSFGKAHSLKELQTDTLALYDHVRKMVAGKLVVHGHSFGSFVAARLASFRPLDGLVLEGTCTSADAYASNMVPWFAKPFVHINLDSEISAIDNRTALQNVDAPIFIINSDGDTQTPEASAYELFVSLKKPNKRYEKSIGTGHMNAMSKPTTIKAYREFLNGQY
ncbi:alpha/beta hydrolase [Undibacterium sp. Ji22W]|uniref:alpha/beta hydrolase n=1 Tax=Undibacterium sp. Ji22W TaxID=3413038 RepID=UPI003BF378B7